LEKLDKNPAVDSLDFQWSRWILLRPRNQNGMLALVDEDIVLNLELLVDKDVKQKEDAAVCDGITVELG
jgi:hypothetical protein